MRPVMTLIRSCECADWSESFALHTYPEVHCWTLWLIFFSVLTLTHCRLNRLSNTIYRKSPISILGTAGCEIYIFLKKNGWTQTVETLIRRRVLRRLIWVCTVRQLPFYGSPDYNGLTEFVGCNYSRTIMGSNMFGNNGNLFDICVVKATEW